MENQDTGFFWKNIVMGILIMVVIVALMFTIFPGLRKQLFQYKDINTTGEVGENWFNFAEGDISVKFQAAYHHNLEKRELGKFSETEMKTKAYINDLQINKINEKGKVEFFIVVLIQDKISKELFTNDLVRSPVEITFPLTKAKEVAVYRWDSKEWIRSYASNQNNEWVSNHDGTGLYAVIVEKEYLVDLPTVDPNIAVV